MTILARVEHPPAGGAYRYVAIVQRDEAGVVLLELEPHGKAAVAWCPPPVRGRTLAALAREVNGWAVAPELLTIPDVELRAALVAAGATAVARATEAGSTP